MRNPLENFGRGFDQLIFPKNKFKIQPPDITHFTGALHYNILIPVK